MRMHHFKNLYAIYMLVLIIITINSSTLQDIQDLIEPVEDRINKYEVGGLQDVMKKICVEKDIKILGGGTYGVVLNCSNELGLAVKLFNVDPTKSKDLVYLDEKIKMCKEEIENQKKFEGIAPKIYGNFIQTNSKYMYYGTGLNYVHNRTFVGGVFMETCSGGDLHRHFKDNEESRFNKYPEEEFKKLAEFLDTSIQTFQQNNFIHKDIKPENIVRCGDQYKIIDFDNHGYTFGYLLKRTLLKEDSDLKKLQCDNTEVKYKKDTEIYYHDTFSAALTLAELSAIQDPKNLKTYVRVDKKTNIYKEPTLFLDPKQTGKISLEEDEDQKTYLSYSQKQTLLFGRTFYELSDRRGWIKQGGCITEMSDTASHNLSCRDTHIISKTLNGRGMKSNWLEEERFIRVNFMTEQLNTLLHQCNATIYPTVIKFLLPHLHFNGNFNNGEPLECNLLFPQLGNKNTNTVDVRTINLPTEDFENSSVDVYYDEVLDACSGMNKREKSSNRT